MPSMASLTVKKSDGTTDIVFDQLAASAGENVPAYWRQDTGNNATLPNGLRSRMMSKTRWNGPRTARIAEVEITFPYALQDSTTTKWSSTDSCVLKLAATMPQSIPGNSLSEAAYQGMNLLAQTLVKEVLRTGYSPT